MIDGGEIGAYSWNSCSEIDELINYLNTLHLSEEEFQQLQELLNLVIRAYQELKEKYLGDDV